MFFARFQRGEWPSKLVYDEFKDRMVHAVQEALENKLALANEQLQSNQIAFFI